MKKILGVIPARYESKRFPGKPLVLINDKPMVQWVYEGCEGVFDHLVVATDDDRIKEAVENFGGNVVITSVDHTSGTERCLEVVKILEQNGESDYEFIVNVQGDEPLIGKEQLIELISCLEKEGTEIATLVKPFGETEDPADPNVVKTVLNTAQQALYFSRSPIPYLREKEAGNNDIYLKHIGLYAFQTSVLKRICDLPISRLEQAESLEQLRWLENGFIIRAQLTKYENIGIDTPDDLKKLEEHLKRMD